MAGKKAAPKAAEVSTVDTGDTRTEPSIDEGLLAAREAALEAEKNRPAPQEPEPPSISDELVAAREAALKAEKDRKTY